MRPLMDFSRFKYIMESIQEFDKKRNRFNDFLEKEICTSSYCIVDFGSEVQQVAINMLADEFDCWYDTGSPFFNHENDKNKEWWETKYSSYSNDIEYWLYDCSPVREDEIADKAIYIGDKKISINTLEEFYEYLVGNYNERNKNLP